MFMISKFKMPTGTILAWYGIIADIPNGWLLCDGENGTPDLKLRCIKGANIDDDVGNAIGNDYHSHRMDFGTHNHSFDDGGHQHVVPTGSTLASGAGIGNMTESTNASGTTGNKDLDAYTDNEDNIPKSRKLFWIMKE